MVTGVVCPHCGVMMDHQRDEKGETRLVVNKWRFFGYILLVLLIGIGMGGFIARGTLVTDNDLVPGKTASCSTAAISRVNAFVDNDLRDQDVPDGLRRLPDFCYGLLDQSVIDWFEANGGLGPEAGDAQGPVDPWG